MNSDIIGLYKHLGADVTTYDFPINIPNDHDAYIILYFYPFGAHYVEAHYDEESKCYEVYNTGVSKDIATIPDLTPSSYKAYEKQNRRGESTTIVQWIVWGIDAPVQYTTDVPEPAEKESK